MRTRTAAPVAIPAIAPVLRLVVSLFVGVVVDGASPGKATAGVMTANPVRVEVVGTITSAVVVVGSAVGGGGGGGAGIIAAGPGLAGEEGYPFITNPPAPLFAVEVQIGFVRD
ncbi:hypothetical protein BDR26DRAFT_857184, partial [Obelidium mucronatum]